MVITLCSDWVLLSLMMFLTAALAIITSVASMRPGWSTRGSSCCDMTASRLEGHLHADLRLLRGRKHVDNPVNSLRGIRSMQSAYDQVPCLGPR